MSARLATNDLEAFWMPFTANRQFKKAPRLFVGAEGHALHHRRRAPRARRHRPDCGASMPATAARRSSRRSSKQVGELDFAGTFQMGHPKAFECASRLVNIAPQGFDHVFFTNSGSESVETALKIALAYHRAKGNALEDAPDRPRARLSRRQLRRHLGRRHRQQPQDVRHAAVRRRSSAATPTIWRATPSAAASRSMAPSSPTILSVSSRCTTPRPSPPSSSSRSRARPAC